MNRHRKSDVRKLILAAQNGEVRSFLGKREGILPLPDDPKARIPDLVLVFFGSDESLKEKGLRLIESLNCPVLAISDQVDLESLGKFLDDFDARWSEKGVAIGG